MRLQRKTARSDKIRKRGVTARSMCSGITQNGSRIVGIDNTVCVDVCCLHLHRRQTRADAGSQLGSGNQDCCRILGVDDSVTGNIAGFQCLGRLRILGEQIKSKAVPFCKCLGGAILIAG